MILKEAAPNPYRWLLHFLTIMYFTMGFMVRFAWPPLIPVASADLGISMSSAGLYMSAFYIGYVFIHIPGGILGDRFGVRLVIGVALFVEALGTFGVGAAPTFAVGFACRLLTGLGAGAVYASCVRYTAALFPPREMGLAFGLMMMAPAGVGVILPNVLMPWLSTVLSWRGAFQAMSAIVLAFGLVALLLVRDTPSKTGSGGNVASGLMAVLKNKNLVFMALAGFWMIWVMVGFVSWGNTYIKELGYSMETASVVMMIYGAAGVIISPIGGVISHRVSSPKMFFAALFLLLAPSAWLFGQIQSFAPLCVMAAVIGILLGLGNPILPVLTSAFAGKELMATAGGVTGCIFQSGAIVGPWVVGISVDLTGSFGAAWLLLAAASVLGALCLLPMQSPKHK